jgi:tRNA dimethylallyltransferase
MQKLIVILGPTASGKSDIAVKLAKKFNGEVISADSRQVYKGLNIGTGKITKKEMKGVRHYLLDVISPILRLRSGQERFTASEYKKLAEKSINKILDKGKIPIICGGTGFYIDTLLGDKQIPEVPPNEKLRKQLEKKSAEQLFEILKKLDPERAKTIEKQNPRRLIRAIEIYRALGKVPRYETREKKYKVLKIGIAPIKEITHPPTPSLNLREGAKGKGYVLDEQELQKKINKRIKKWFKRGLLKEVQNLHKKGLPWKRMSEIGLEYKIVSNYLKKNTKSSSAKVMADKQEMVERMQIKTRQYAKRQMTWFKRDKNTIWLSPKIGLIEKDVRKFI